MNKFKKISQLKVGVVLSYANIALSISVGLVLTPLIIRSLGDSEYGLYTLIGSFVAYLSLLDLGLNYAVVRFVAKYRAEKDIEGENSFLSTAIFIYILIAAILVLVGSILYFNIELIFDKSLSGEQLSDAKIMYIILLFNLVVTLPGNTFSAICNAYEHFIFPRIISVIRYVLRVCVIYGVLKLGGKAIALVVVDTFFNLFLICSSFLYTRIKLKVKITFKRANLEEIKQIFSYTAWIFISTIVFSFQWQAGQVVLGINTSTVVVAIYAVGIMLGSYYTTFASAINSVLIPKATQMVVANSSGDQLTDAMIRVGRLNNYLLLLVLSGFFLFGMDFIKLWLGDGYNESWIVAMLVMLVYTVPMTQIFGNSILEAKNKISFRAIWDIISMSVAVIIGFFASRTYGITGVILCLVIAKAINIVAINVYYKYVFGFRILLFLKKTFFVQVVIVAMLTVVTYLIKSNFDHQSWKMLAGSVIVYVIVYLLLNYLFVFSGEEKEMFSQNFRSL